MDDTGKVFIGITIAVVLVAVVLFYVLSNKGPRGSVLIVAAALFFCGVAMPPNNSRELHLLEGILRLVGVIGGILGIIDLVRKRPPRTLQDDEIIEATLLPPRDDDAEE